LAERVDASVWIGANDREEEGSFRWAGGSDLGYAAWIFGQPNDLDGAEDCVELRGFDGGWIDIACTVDVARGSLCEQPP
jgi:hypothetical protein